ncbi:MAG TPA: hypothetical protein VFQ24_12900 [Terriglobia bacterium]|nr:hypothetical protein [Terriglobia bacterium]
MAEESNISTRAVLRGGIAGGVIAGLPMLAFAMVHAEITGAGFSSPLRWIAASLGDVCALIMAGEARGSTSTPGVLFTGAIIHLLFSAGWGIVFVRLFPRLRGIAALGVGLLYGVGVWVVMTWGVLTWLDRPMYDRVQLVAGAFFMQHLVYGGCLALAPCLARRWPGKGPVNPSLTLRLN